MKCVDHHFPSPFGGGGARTSSDPVRHAAGLKLSHVSPKVMLTFFSRIDEESRRSELGRGKVRGQLNTANERCGTRESARHNCPDVQIRQNKEGGNHRSI